MYYDVAYANIKSINLLDKLLIFFLINKKNPVYVHDMFNILLSKTKITYLDVHIFAYPWNQSFIFG